MGRRSYTAPNHPGTPPCLCPLCDSEQWGLASPCLTSVAHGPHALPPLQRQVEANVRNKILYLIQAWAHAFRNEPKYKVVQDTYQIMKVEGHVFPEFKESDAMFAAERVSRVVGS